MKPTLVLIFLLLGLFPTLGQAGEPPFHTDQTSPDPVQVSCQQLSEEELGLVRGGTPGNAPPEVHLPRTADIILWDEARTKGNTTIQRSRAAEVVTINIGRGR